MEVAGIRARNREAMMKAITQAAGEQLRDVGPAALSVRAVARDLGMASSAIYRYVRSRDELLTLLILAGYNDMADHVEDAASRVRNPRRRFTVIGLACREWAVAHPQRFALIYGSPVPGYEAPQETIAAATRVPALLVQILAEVHADPHPTGFSPKVARSLAPIVAAVAEWAEGADFSDAAMAIGVMAWTHVIGAISFELFGHRHNVVGDSEKDKRTYFEFELDVLAGLVGL